MVFHNSSSFSQGGASKKPGVIQEYLRKTVDPNYSVNRQCLKIRDAVTQVLVDAANVIGLRAVEISKHGDVEPNAIDNFLEEGAHQEVDLKNGSIIIRAYVEQPGLLMLSICQSGDEAPQDEQHPLASINPKFDMRHLLDMPHPPANAAMYSCESIVSHDASRPLSLTLLDILRVFSLENNLTVLTALEVYDRVTYVFIDKA